MTITTLLCGNYDIDFICQTYFVLLCLTHIFVWRHHKKNCFCVTLIHFLPLIKWVPQFLIKEKLFLERERGDISLSLSTLIASPQLRLMPTSMQGKWACVVSQVR